MVVVVVVGEGGVGGVGVILPGRFDCLFVFFLNLAVGETMPAGRRGCFICLPTLNVLHLSKASAFRFAGTAAQDLVLPEVSVKPSDFQPLQVCSF